VLSHIVLTCLLGAAQLLPLPEASTLVKDGELTKKGKQVIASALTQVPSGAPLTVVGCASDALPVLAAKGLANQVVSELAARKPPVSMVVRNVAVNDCDAGFLVEVGTVIDTTAPEATVIAAKGKVEGKLADGRVIPLYKGSIVNPRAVVTTGAGSHCTISLPDGSLVRLGDNGQFSLDEFQKAGAKKRKVSLRLLAGRAWAKVGKLLGDDSSWELGTGNAIAGVRGTAFQLATTQEGGGTKTQVGVHEGAVSFDVGIKKVEVPEGYGSKAVGTNVSDPQPLPPAPTKLQPQQGEFVKETIASWTPVKGAVQYRLEVAGDPEFTDIRISLPFVDNRIRLASPAGTFYWRVITIDKEGFESKPSAQYKIVFHEKT
jgi:hypothetical protein